MLCEGDDRRGDTTTSRVLILVLMEDALREAKDLRKGE